MGGLAELHSVGHNATADGTGIFQVFLEKPCVATSMHQAPNLCLFEICIAEKCASGVHTLSQNTHAVIAEEPNMLTRP